MAVLTDGSGKVAWQNTTRVYVPSMIAKAGRLYAVTDAGIAVCWKSDTGEELWKERLGGDFFASPVIARREKDDQPQSPVVIGGFAIVETQHFRARADQTHRVIHLRESAPQNRRDKLTVEFLAELQARHELRHD